ncbi:MAG: HNH endonuclease [Verrucomicrobiae bacterium]|nr:HNH endonuclease [Verrucomicrobiae bacterium]MCB1089643.1 HNH endonuclease [Verrucomicrobiae bacterium]
MSITRIPDELRGFVRDRAQGRCEYCLIPEVLTFQRHQVDHIIAEKHGGPTEKSNLALSCVLCNVHKGTDLTSVLPVTGAITPLFHPRRDRWDDHFSFRDGTILPKTPEGWVTARLLRFNAPERIQERLLAAGAGVVFAGVELEK